MRSAERYYVEIAQAHWPHFTAETVQAELKHYQETDQRGRPWLRCSSGGEDSENPPPEYTYWIRMGTR